MAQKRTTSTKKKTTSNRPASTKTKVTRIKAEDKPHELSPAEKAAKRSVLSLRKTKNAPKPAEVATQEAEKKRAGIARVGRPFAALWGYFRGAWYELRQVRWPDRASSWQMTGALIGFCIFFVAAILLLDAGFKYLFEQLIG